MKLLVNFWNDQDGGLISAELILVGTILVIALVVGLTALRNAINTELADLASAIAHIDNSFSVDGITGRHASCAGQLFEDQLDDGDDPGTSQPGGANSRCLILCVTPTGEGGQ